MTTVDTTRKLPRKPTSHRAVQRRLERYAAMGPNCPNGHPWALHAKFTKLGFRFCDACTREQADERRNDPMTYTGTCPHGHEYTRENTMITCRNAKKTHSVDVSGKWTPIKAKQMISFHAPSARPTNSNGNLTI